MNEFLESIYKQAKDFRRSIGRTGSIADICLMDWIILTLNFAIRAKRDGDSLFELTNEMKKEKE